MKLIYLYLLLTITLAGCGGGPSGNGEASTAQLPVGVFCGELTDADCLNSTASAFEKVKFDD